MSWRWTTVYAKNILQSHHAITYERARCLSHLLNNHKSGDIDAENLETRLFKLQGHTYADKRRHRLMAVHCREDEIAPVDGCS